MSPDTPAGVQVDASGCPVDTDGDGIPDHLDRCPKLPGIPANNGCPEIKEEVKTLFKKALNGIQFESGKAVIKKTSYPILDDIVKVMAENPDYNLTVSGHTDNVGKPDKNEVLSENRAQSVKDYLVQHGIEDKRIIPLGFGDSRPVEDNKTPSGRAKNRRVDFEVSFEVVSTQSTTIK
ncbi:MAG: OmpA family protein [Dysgonamonadaceae bacterium]|nr:OmpA family protein [Dysgonamonadaceae bacterium]